MSKLFVKFLNHYQQCENYLRMFTDLYTAASTCSTEDDLFNTILTGKRNISTGLQRVLEDIRSSTDVHVGKFRQPYMLMNARNDPLVINGKHAKYFIITTLDEVQMSRYMIENMRRESRIWMSGMYHTYIYTIGDNEQYVPLVNISMYVPFTFQHPLIKEDARRFVQNFTANESSTYKPINFCDGDIFRTLLVSDNFVESYCAASTVTDHFSVQGYRTQLADECKALTSQYPGLSLVQIYQNLVSNNTKEENESYIFNLRLLGFQPYLILQMCMLPTYCVAIPGSSITYNQEQHNFLMHLGSQ